MNLKHSLALCIAAAGLTVARAEGVKFNPPAQGDQAGAAPAAAAPAAPAPATAAPTPAPTFTDAQVAEELGWFYGKRMGLSELGFSAAETQALLKGLSSAAAGKDSPFDLEKISPRVEEFMQQKQAAYLAKLKEQSNAENLAFFTKLKENKNIVELPDGLRYEIVQAGNGAYPKAEDTVKVHYTGTLVNGSVFDSSVERKEPATFALKEVIPGWTEGIQKINKGGKIKLYVPPHLAYGDDPRPGIPPGSTLIFDVELLDINPPAPAAPTPTPAPATK
ncbi:FKBP-type peptidyl-prolyl cis-trans isomerase [Opitutus sp. ER46]|uniref:FKBP-type peptidyl-prolyl cis-trans isomerase n=1 Tax=Opitutus sp. ER46 TaxID=2161864 RepID=UPI000D320A9F|nr:FKBP-type peptidyl-prolyl cis-trans isomerase [Opitutus sp. ER46]PTX92567.1 peptidylprolyl isomerase [Opitutus sp. ER46]